MKYSPEVSWNHKRVWFYVISRLLFKTPFLCTRATQGLDAESWSRKGMEGYGRCTNRTERHVARVIFARVNRNGSGHDQRSTSLHPPVDLRNVFQLFVAVGGRRTKTQGRRNASTSGTTASAGRRLWIFVDFSSPVTKAWHSRFGTHLV